MSTSPENETLYSPREVARILGVNTYTVRKWLRDGTMTGIKIGEGKHWRITKTELDRVLQERVG